MHARELALSSLLLFGSACRVATGDPSSTVPATVPDVLALDVASAQQQMAAGTLDARTLTAAYLERIAALDDAGAKLNAVIELNPNALAEAEQLDHERAAGRLRGPLHGIPVLIKDNIDVLGMANSAGSLALAEHRPERDAALVARLREAGVVVLGKTNLSEWANFRSTHSSSGWSSRGGQTRNPHVLDRSPCGSSSGSAVAVAAGLALLAVGTETDGSILCPASINGIVGLKPSVGLISREGIIPISSTQDTAGPMAGSVRDVALLLDAMVDRPPSTSYAASLREDALVGKRIGVLRQAMGNDTRLDALTEQAIARMRAAGATLVDVEIATWEQWGDAEFQVLLSEFEVGIDAYLAGTQVGIADLSALIEYDRAHAERLMPYFEQEVFELALEQQGLDDPKYLQARADARRMAWDEGLGATLEREQLDAVIAPTTGPAWTIDLLLGDANAHSSYGVAAVSGTPSLTVPLGDIMGLPVGLAFMSGPNSEAQLLALGYAFEQSTHARIRPRMLPTLAFP